MIITKEILDQGKSSRNVWNNKQLAVFGEEMVKGWYWRLVGKEVTEEQVRQFLELKDNHLRNYLQRVKHAPERKYVKLKKPVFESCNKPIEYKDQYLHPNWQRMRLFILDRDGFCCQECGAKDQLLHVHHLKYNKNNYIWMVPTWYLVTLCDGCHSKEHGRDLTIKK